MKKLLFLFFFLFLLIPCISFAQPVLDTTARYIPMYFSRPEIDKGYEKERKTVYIYVITKDSVYSKVFSRFPKESLRVVDFSKQEVVVRIACTYCLALGLLDDGEPRHRNVCSYGVIWFVRDKKKDF